MIKSIFGRREKSYTASPDLQCFIAFLAFQGAAFRDAKAYEVNKPRREERSRGVIPFLGRKDVTTLESDLYKYPYCCADAVNVSEVYRSQYGQMWCSLPLDLINEQDSVALLSIARGDMIDADDLAKGYARILDAVPALALNQDFIEGLLRYGDVSIDYQHADLVIEKVLEYSRSNEAMGNLFYTFEEIQKTIDSQNYPYLRVDALARLAAELMYRDFASDLSAE